MKKIEMTIAEASIIRDAIARDIDNGVNSSAIHKIQDVRALESALKVLNKALKGKPVSYYWKKQLFSVSIEYDIEDPDNANIEYQ